MRRRCCCEEDTACCACLVTPESVQVKIKSGTYTVNKDGECRRIGAGTASDGYYTSYSGRFDLPATQYGVYENGFWSYEYDETPVDEINIRVLVEETDSESDAVCSDRIVVEVWFTNNGVATCCVEPTATTFGSSVGRGSGTSGSGCYLFWFFDSAGRDSSDPERFRPPCSACRKMHHAKQTGLPDAFGGPFYNQRSSFYGQSYDPQDLVLVYPTTGPNCMTENFDLWDNDVLGLVSAARTVPKLITSSNSSTIDCCSPCSSSNANVTLVTGLSRRELIPGSCETIFGCTFDAFWDETERWVLDHDGDCTWSAEFSITPCDVIIPGFGGDDTYTVSSLEIVYVLQDAINASGVRGTYPLIFFRFYEATGELRGTYVWQVNDETDPDTDLNGSYVVTPHTNGGEFDPYPTSTGCPDSDELEEFPGIPFFGNRIWDINDLNDEIALGNISECFTQIGGSGYIVP